MTSLESNLRQLRSTGRKALVPYFMGGLSHDWTDHVAAAIHAGADAVEIGIPFSDPMMDGIVIQEAALRALNRGTNLDTVCGDISRLDATVPFVAMTYYNIFHHYGIERSAGTLGDSGFQGAIVPDLALEEATEWSTACAAHDIATIFLVAPSTPRDRIPRLVSATQGFAYASARMAVTGRASTAGDGARVVEEIRAASDVPTYIGIGVTTPAQAHDAALQSDGVIVGSALVQLLLDGGGPTDVERFIHSFRSALD